MSLLLLEPGADTNLFILEPSGQYVSEQGAPSAFVMEPGITPSLLPLEPMGQYQSTQAGPTAFVLEPGILPHLFLLEPDGIDLPTGAPDLTHWQRYVWEKYKQRKLERASAPSSKIVSQRQRPSRELAKPVSAVAKVAKTLQKKAPVVTDEFSRELEQAREIVAAKIAQLEQRREAQLKYALLLDLQREIDFAIQESYDDFLLLILLSR